VINKRGLNT